MSRFGSDEGDEMREARRKAAEDQRRYDIEGDRAYERDRASWLKDEELAFKHNGYWRFEEITNTHGSTIGWRVTLDDKLVGIVMVRGEELTVLSTTRDAGALRRGGVENPDRARLLNEPNPEEIMAAFIKLYPTIESRQERLAPRQRALPSENPFGPPRNWDEE